MQIDINEINKLKFCSYCRPIEDYEEKETKIFEEIESSSGQDFQSLDKGERWP